MINIEVYLEHVLSEKQREIYQLIRKGESNGEIARQLNINTSTVRVQRKRIREKQQKTNLPSIEDNNNDIQELFESETDKHKKITVSQAQFLSNTDKMHTDRQKAHYYRKNLGIKKEKVTKRVMSEEELKKAREKTPKGNGEYTELKACLLVAKQARLYSEGLENNSSNIEYMAQLEIILRAYGIIYRTPYINKLNRKTGEMLRAKCQGKIVQYCAPDDRNLLPQGAKYIETSRDYLDNHVTHTVWIV